jgi:hypothetical protein
MTIKSNLIDTDSIQAPVNDNQLLAVKTKFNQTVEPANNSNDAHANKRVAPRWGPNHAGAKYLAEQYTKSKNRIDWYS